MSEDEVYLKLIEHLKGIVFDLPEHEELVPILKLRVTPEEAALLIKISGPPQTAEELSGKIQVPLEELEPMLKTLAKKGCIIYTKENGEIKYRGMDPFSMLIRFTGWVEDKGDWYEKIAPKLNKYYIDAWGAEVTSTPTQPMRAVVVNETVDDPRQIAPYEHIVKHLDQFTDFAVSPCSCRMRHNVDPDMHDCKQEVETCLHWGDLGKFVIETGMGRSITKEETLEILKNAADAGLVHAFYNNIADNDTICNCCSDCCIYLEKIKQAPGIMNPRGQNPSNYIRVWADEEKCIKCGLCAKRCPVDAIEFNKEEKLISFTPKRCLGCGVCVHKCPTSAIVMIRRDKDLEPHYPKNLMEMGMNFRKERGKPVPPNINK